jgi:branched-chain amino acid transport system ATP-binding protein
MRAVDQLQLQVASGSITALLGANGAGKSSTIMCIAGHVEMQGGSIYYDGAEYGRPFSHGQGGGRHRPGARRAAAFLQPHRSGKPGGGRLLPPRRSDGGQHRKVLATFPRLGERLHQRAGSLSGGEQQMLAIGRALMSQPRLLLVDELSLGLMPTVIDVCYGAIEDLKSEGHDDPAGGTIHPSGAGGGRHAVTVLESGRQVWSGTARQARHSTDMIDAFLGLKPS